MSRVQVDLLDADGLRPFEEQLRALERDVTYPIEEGADRFWIDHGETYATFFSQMGRSRFLVVREQERVLGIGVGIRRSCVGLRGVQLPVLYGADLKFAVNARGRGLAQRLFRRGLLEIFREPAFWGWQLIFGAAMRDARGDVRRSFKQATHPGRLGTTLATLRVFFVPVSELRKIRGDGPAPPRSLGLDLGAVRQRPLVEDTAGRKDLRLVSNGRPWPLQHLPRSPVQWGAGLGAMLREAAEMLPGGDLACFALDERLHDQLAYLETQGVRSETRCTIVAMPGLPAGPAAWLADWVHLPTSEI